MGKVSTATLKRSIRYWLRHPPQEVDQITDIRHVICDGTFLEHRTGIYAMLNAITRRLVHAEFDVSEGAPALLAWYRTLATAGLSIHSATVDGNPHQIKYLIQVWPLITIQRCIVHVQRQGLSWCRRYPKRTDAKHLRKIFLQLSSVSTSLQAQQFITNLQAWEKRFGLAIDRSSDRGWVFSDLVRARSMVLKALPDLFHYITNSNIPKSTNLLENYFGRLKERYRRHRGLAPHHRPAYFQWYFYFVNH